MFEKGHGYQGTFKDTRQEIDKIMMEMEITEEKTKLLSMKKEVN